MSERVSEPQQSDGEAAAAPQPVAAPGLPAVALLTALQRTAGNRAVGRMLAARAPPRPPRERTLARVELWRGQAEGVGPQPGDTHDLGPGLYLATTETLGRRYVASRVLIRESGTRVSHPELGRLLYTDVPLESLGRVLDLTQDPRWAAYINGSDFDGPSRLQLIEINYQHAYWPYFQEFLRRNGMRLEDYDTIMAPEYLRGDVQVCVRNPEVMARLRPDLRVIASGAAAMPLPPSPLDAPPVPILPRPRSGSRGVRGGDRPAAPARTQPAVVDPLDAPLPGAAKPRGGTRGGGGGSGPAGVASHRPPAEAGAGRRDPRLPLRQHRGRRCPTTSGQPPARRTTCRSSRASSTRAASHAPMRTRCCST